MSYQGDPINHVVDILLSPNQKVNENLQQFQIEAERLDKKRQELDSAFKRLCDERVQDFNTILFSVRPLEHSLNELAVHVDGLQKSSKVIKDELMSQTNLQNFRQLEFKSLYYQEMIEGLQVFEKIERLIESVDFLQTQQNLYGAALEFNNLKNFIQQQEIKSLLQEFGVQEQLKKRISDKQKYLIDSIMTNVIDILFTKSNSLISSKIEQIQNHIDGKLMKINDDFKILEYVAQETSDLKKVTESFQRIHTKEFESAQRVSELLQGQGIDDSLQQGMIFLQRDYKKAIEAQNCAYLSIMVSAYSKISDDPIQEHIRQRIDIKIQQFIQQIIENLIAMTKINQKNRNFQSVHSDKIKTELVLQNGVEIRNVTQAIQSIFFFFFQNLKQRIILQNVYSYFLIIDKISSQKKQDSISVDYVNMFFYYFKMIIQILFDHDKRIKDFNLKNGISADTAQKQQLSIEKNLRFSFRNNEEVENFLVDSVKLKLDFYKKLEDIIVPHLFNRNISNVMILGNRILFMIDGIVDYLDSNLTTTTKMDDNKQQIQAFKGWMRRFIVTNYEIYLDYFKQHSEFVAQKYFNKSLSIQQLYKSGLGEDKFQMTQSQAIQNFQLDQRGSMMQISKASIIGKLSLQKQYDDDSMWTIFDYVVSFSQIAQLAIERIPLDDQKKQDQAQFRQEILETVNKIMKKVYDKMNQLVTLCFNNSHKDTFFPSKFYETEKEQYYFKGLIKKEDSKKDKSSNESIEDSEFLYKPKLAIHNEQLSNSMNTLILLLQIYQRLNSVAIKEFNSCYQYILSKSLWEQLLSENSKKEFSRYYSSIQSITYDILIFFRCELTTRCFIYLREMTKTDFVGITSSQRVEPFAQSLIRDVKILHNFMTQYLGPIEIFYLLSHLLKFVIRLYGHYIRFIKRQQVDEQGFQRLKTSLFQIKVDFELIIPKLLSVAGENTQKLQKIRDDMKVDIAREYEKTIYIIQFLVCDEQDIPIRIKENDFGLTEQDFGYLLNIKQNYQFQQNNE